MDFGSNFDASILIDCWASTEGRKTPNSTNILRDVDVKNIFILFFVFFFIKVFF